MTDLVSVCSKVTIGSETYTIPDELVIQPDDIYDDHEGLYRISLGKTNMTPDEAAMYAPLFLALNKQKHFIENICFEVNGNVLHFAFAYIEKTVKRYGMFFDIEATEDYVDYRERKTIEQT